jgi:hypothetical protein
MGIWAEPELPFYARNLLLFSSRLNGDAPLMNLQYDRVLSNNALGMHANISMTSQLVARLAAVFGFFFLVFLRASLPKHHGICLHEAFTPAFLFPDQHSHLQVVKTLGHSSFAQLKGNWLKRSAMAHFRC